MGERRVEEGEGKGGKGEGGGRKRKREIYKDRGRDKQIDR